MRAQTSLRMRLPRVKNSHFCRIYEAVHCPNNCQIEKYPLKVTFWLKLFLRFQMDTMDKLYEEKKLVQHTFKPEKE